MELNDINNQLSSLSKKGHKKSPRKSGGSVFSKTKGFLRVHVVPVSVIAFVAVMSIIICTILNIIPPKDQIYAANHFENDLGSGNPSYNLSSLPTGFSTNEPSATDKTKTSARNPSSLVGDKCYITLNTVYLTDSYEGFGVRTLSERALTDYANYAPVSPVGNMKTLDVKVGGGSLRFAGIQLGENTFVAARTYGSVNKVPKDIKTANPLGLETATKQGIPTSIMSYTCKNAADFNVKDAKMALSRVSLNWGQE